MLQKDTKKGHFLPLWYSICMAELKTKKTTKSVTQFIAAIKDSQKKADSQALVKLMREASREKPALWGSSIVGFGSYHYKSERSSQEGDWPLTGFSPRKQNLTIYIMPGFGKYGELLKKLGKYKTSVGCLYLNKLSDVHLPTLKKLVAASVRDMKKRYKA
jgi:hypothetical protein